MTNATGRLHDRYARHGTPTARWCVRSVIVERGVEIDFDEGPWDRHLAELVLADIGIDASIPRGIGRVPVLRARLVPLESAQLAGPDGQ